MTTSTSSDAIVIANATEDGANDGGWGRADDVRRRMTTRRRRGWVG
jgi:hypothetical protein